MSDSLRPLGLYSPWNSPGQNTGVGSLSLLQGIFPTQGSNPGLPHCRQILYELSYQGRKAIWSQTFNLLGANIIFFFKRCVSPRCSSENVLINTYSAVHFGGHGHRRLTPWRWDKHTGLLGAPLLFPPPPPSDSLSRTAGPKVALEHGQRGRGGWGDWSRC